VKRYPGMALVTGASSGIGAEFARQLAQAGYELILVARRQDRLDELAAGLSADTRTVCADLSTHDGCEAVIQSLGDAPVGIFVHAAGFGAMGLYECLPLERQLEMVNLNARAAVHLSARLAPGMCARGNGAMIFVASIAAFQAAPWLATYGATKSFVLSLAEALHVEYTARGIDVLALCPGPTRTEFAAVAAIDVEPPAAMSTEPGPVVETALAALGRKPFVVHGTSNRLSALLAKIVPRHLAARVSGKIMRNLSHRLKEEASGNVAPPDRDSDTGGRT
jgi:short-subunit dehydrogenase